MKMVTTTLCHPLIGNIVGNADSGVVERYLGLQYATLTDRFAPPELRTYSSSNTIDATSHGPQVLALPNGEEHEHKLLQHSLDYDREAVQMSDVDGLNLNVFVPASDEVSARRSLPVLVFIHGGGFNGGSSSYPSHDMTRFVRLSMAKGMPVVGVSLNYRVGAPGFLHSTEMKEAGYLPNNGFCDQRTALSWLQKYIGGFGGDPDDVTLMGESAGAVSTAIHLHSEQPLFKRAMLMSGSTLLKGPAPIAVADVAYQKASEVLGLDSLTPKERVQKLVCMDGQQLRATLLQHGVAPLVAMPLVDGDLCPVGVDFKSVMDGTLNLPGRHWCEAIVLGDCAFDGSILGLPLGRKKAGIAKAFVTSIKESLPEKAALKLLAGYGLTPSTEDDQAFERVLRFGGDVSFYAPTFAFAQGLGEDMPVYVYRFNEPNNWPGPWQGRTTHIHDLTFLFQNFNEFLSGEQNRLAEEFATDVLRFVNHKKPWQRWKNTQRVAKIFATDGRGVKEDVPEQTGRSRFFVDLAEEVGYDTLRGALNRFMAS